MSSLCTSAQHHQPERRTLADAFGAEVVVQRRGWNGKMLDQDDDARALAERFTVAVEHLLDGYFALDRDSRVTYVNGAAERMFKRSRTELLGSHLWTQLPEARDILQRACEQALRDNAPARLEALYAPWGRWIEARAVPSEQGLAVYVRDTTRERAAEAALRTSEERFRLLSRATSDAIWDWDLCTDEVRWNEGLTTLFGHRREDVDPTVSSWTGCIHPGDLDRVTTGIHRVIDHGGDTWTDQYRFRRHDGSYAPVLDHGDIIRDAEGTAIRMIGGMTDRTEAHLAEEALRRQQTELRVLFDFLPAMIVFKDTEDRILRTNKRLADTIGLAVEQVEGRLSLEIFPQDAAKYYADDVEVVRSGLPKLGIVETMHDGDGHERWIQTDKVPVFASDGAVAGIIVMAQDITTRIEAESQIRLSEIRYRSLVEATAAIVWDTPASGKFERDQPRWGAFTGQTFEELSGWGWLNAVHADDQAETARVWSAAVADRTIYKVEHRLRARDRTYRNMLVRAVPILAADGTILQWIGVHTDITDLKRAELEITRSNQALQVEIVERTRAEQAADAANRAKSQFLENMSHELRTPLNGVLGMTELALMTDLSVEQRDYLGTVKSSSEALLRVVNDILDFSKLEARQLAVDVIPFDLSDCLATTLQSLAPQAHAKSLELAWDISPDVPVFVVGDAGRLRQVVTTLLDNAIKFTASGELVLTVEAEQQTNRDALLRFSVSDTGIGVSREQHDVIFKPFVQADGSITRKYGGTGLGLALARSVVALLGGRIWLESELGKGSTFHFTVPFNLQPAPARATLRDEQARQLRDLPVLVVDDNAVSRTMLEGALRRWSMRPVLADSGPAGVAAFYDRQGSSERFPLVLLDAQMPGMDGFAVVEAIRKDPTLNGPAILMLTSAGRPGDGARCLALGISAYLAKPVRQADLLDAMVGALEMPSDPAGRRPVITRHSLREGRRPLRVLLVEHHKVNQLIAARLLERRGHVVVIAANREEVSTLLASHGHEFDLVLMDMQMPGMDGCDAALMIRSGERPEVRRVPIIALTGDDPAGEQHRCPAGRIDSYLSKPLAAEQLFATVDRLVVQVSGETGAG